jgi:hypothetical protein
MNVEIQVSNHYVFSFVRRWYAMFLEDQITLQNCKLDLARLDRAFTSIDNMLSNDPIDHLDFSRKKPLRYQIQYFPELSQFMANIKTFDEYFQKAFRLDQVGQLPNDTFMKLKELFNSFMKAAIEDMVKQTLISEREIGNE